MALERITAMPTLPRRPADSNKGMYGSVLVVAGSRGMAGAAALVGAGALRSGPGWSGSPVRRTSSRPWRPSSRLT